MTTGQFLRGRAVILLSLMFGLGATSTALGQQDDSAERRVMDRFLVVLEKTPRRGTALDRVYGYHVEHGSLDDLVKRYQDRTKADAVDGASWLLLGLVEAQRGRDAAAVAALREAEKLRPDDPLVPYYLGQALVLVGQPDTAVEAFERALTRKPSRVDLLEIYQALGRVHQRARRSDKALEVWARLEATFPDDARVREQIAATLAEEDQPAQALAKYEALARSVKDEYRKVQFAIEAAELKVKLGRSPDALADFERLLGKLDPGSWLFKEVRRKVEDVFLRGDDLAGLAKYYESWIARTPDDVDAMARLGKTFAQLGRAADSRTWLDKAVKLAPSRRDLRLALIEQLALEKKFNEASGQYEALVKAEPNNPDLVRDWGRLLLRETSRPEADRKAAASAVWKRLAGDSVKDAVAIAQVADLHRSAEMVDDAIALYKRAIAMAPDSPQYREYLGEYYHQLKRPADALATWTGGSARTATEKGRLGEVLAGFGYRKEALAPLSDAVKLAPDDFDVRLKLADLLMGLDRPTDALAELVVAAKLADAPERSEAVLEREIHAHQAAKTLGRQVATLRADLEAGQDATADRWTRLARFFEADGKPTEAIRAATRGTVADPKSVAAWSTLGRLQESSGNLGAAADTNRTLAGLDRRNRADYLSAIARLEARLGRTRAALEAGRELLAASPGNVERHQEFAELCFGLGEVEEGLDALRRASRANPSDPKASNVLADALARQFRTEEAIELYWRAFDRTSDLDERLGVVNRLTDQYLQRNQFDRLIARLERELREPERKRELTLCLAQAHQAAGDLGTARQELESLLANNPRDSALLTQLSNLAEAEGDVNGASRYLKAAVDVAPTPESTARLGNLYLRAGEVSEAEAVWSRLASADQDAGRAFSAIDSLISAGKYDTVLTLTERLLLKRPDDWDALYREGVALANLAKPAEAARRFAKILDLRAIDDDLAAIPKSRKRGGSTGPSSVQSVQRAAYYQFPVYLRRVAVNQIRSVTRLETLRVYANANAWTPADFGQARMAALGWLYAASLKDADPDAWAKARQLEAERPGADPRSLWDLYYLQLVRAMPAEVFAATVRLARALPGDPAAQYVFLTSLPTRAITGAAVVRVGNAAAGTAADKTPPLPPDEQALVLESFESLRKRRPDLIQAAILNSVSIELKRAKRDGDADVFYRSMFESANTVEAVSSLFTLATERGDVDGLLTLFERHDRLVSASNQPASALAGGTSAVASSIARAMGGRADAKDYPGVLRLLDHAMASAARPDQLAGRLKARSNPGGLVGTNYYTIFTSNRPQAIRSTTIDFPLPNAYFDHSAIYTLRNAFEVFRKDDLTSDLLARFRTQVEKADAGAKLFPTLGLSYLLWWNDEKDEALKEYAHATELAPADVELRLSLAELRAQRGEPVEALEAADSIEPLDQKTMQRRETLALRLAVLGGDVNRARKAAERLFGLRLDADTQVQLATQMNQLGMHELSEAVLARARRRSGGNAQALASLMRQYQRQGKTDVAIQVANQVLRQTGGQRTTAANVVTTNDQARTEAVQVFARSGKLKELIARAEAQLETSPTSQQLLQTLVDYYQADGQRDKVRATYKKIAALRPDDARLQMQIGVQLSQGGAAADSLDYFRAALQKEPALFSNNSFQVQRAFQQAGKSDELVKMFEGMDFKSLGSSSVAIRNLLNMMSQDSRSRDAVMAIFRKAWKDLPEARPSLLNSLYNADVWKLPEIYDYAREVIIPPAGRPVANPWAGMDTVTMWMGGGNVNTPATQLLDASNRQGKLDALAAEVEAAVSRSADWSAGKAILGILKARRGKVDEARALLEPLAKPDPTVPVYARMVIGQELDSAEALRDLAIKILEPSAADVEQLRGNLNGFDYGPGKRLALLYQKVGRGKEARDLVLRAARTPGDSNQYDASYAGYQRVEEAVGFGSLLSQLGYPADAARFYSDISNDTQALEGMRQVYGGQDPYTNQIANGLSKALQPMDGETLARSLRAILTPRANAKPGEPKLDLVLLCHPRDLDKSSVVCLFLETLKGAKGSKDGLAEVRETLDRLLASDPDDFSILVASTLFASLDGNAEALAGPLDRLSRRIDAQPLEPLPANGRANARQRDEAARSLILWVVAREAAKHDASRSTAEKLASRATEAAKRQLDNRWSLAMLREAGQDALDRGDKAAAEASWRGMLKLVMTSAAPPKPVADVEIRTVVVASGAVSQVATKAANPAVKFASSPGNAVVTLERFEQVAQFAKLASDRGLTALSIQAVRDALAGGPPVTPMAITNGARTVVRMNRDEAQADPVAQKVEEHLFALDPLWSKGQAEPVAVYEVYRQAVLPSSRPGEIFLYARPLSLGSLKLPRSVGALLVRWAVKAGKADELKAAIEARQSSPLAVAPAKVLLAQLEFERKNFKESSRLLDAIHEGLTKGGLAVTGEQACLAALPALDVKDTADSAGRVLAAAITRVGSNAENEPAGSLLVRLARHELAGGRAKEGRDLFRDYLTRMERSAARYSGDYGSYLRREYVARVAHEYAKAGQIDDALDLLGQYADAPNTANYGDRSDVAATLSRTLRLLAGAPPEDRYRKLKGWTMPTENRRSIRWLVKLAHEPMVPSPFVAPKPVADRGAVGPPLALVQAARELGRLDALAAELKPLAEAKVENAAVLLALVELGRGDGLEARTFLRSRIKEPSQPNADPDGQQTDASHAMLMADYLLAREALASPDATIFLSGEELALRVVELGKSSNQTWAVGRARRDLAEYQARHAGAPAVASASDPGLAFWSPRNVVGFTPEGDARARPIWAESAGTVAHVVGNGAIDFLLSRYPLTGTFEFSVDAYRGGYAEGTVGYGGVYVDPEGVHSLNNDDRVGRPGGFNRPDAFNRITIRVAPGRVSYLVNGHLFYEDTKASATSPWLGLGALSVRQTAFRDATITGRPEIPRQVNLTGGDGLDGWDVSTYGESTPHRRSNGPGLASDELVSVNRRRPASTRAEDYDWRAVDGEILGRKIDPSTFVDPDRNSNQYYATVGLADESTDGETVRPSRIAYARPLSDGDSVAYEFFHEPDRSMVHPAVGHLAFLIGPDGVKLHALVPPGGVGDVGPASVLDDPAGRKGAVALKAGAWNAATVRYKGGRVALEVNGVLVHDRDLDPDDDRIFSLYHDKAATSARVRNVVLRGDWPSEVPADLLANPLRRSGPEGDRPTRRARGAMIGDSFLALSAGEVARSARKLPASERYARLLAWVLPSDDHGTIRLAAEFGPTDSPVAPADARATEGGGLSPTLDSPAIDLIAAAKEAGKLDDLLAAIGSAEAATSADRRGQLALRALTLDAQGKAGEAASVLNDWKDKVKTLIAKQTPDLDRWPELIAGSALAARPGLNAAATGLLDEVVAVIQRDFYAGALERPIRHARGAAQLLASKVDQPVDRRDWITATLGTAETRGRGYPLPAWTRREGAFHHAPGHHVDLLFLATPLRGDFEITCDLTSFHWREARLSHGGTSIGLNWSLKEFEVQRYGRWTEANGRIDPPVKDVGDWYPFRLVVKNGRMTTYAQGRKLDERAITGEADPWLALFSSASLTTGVRNLKIAGTPTIPDRIVLSNSSDLTGWLGDYYGEATQGDDAAWKKRGDEIVGRRLRHESVAVTDDDEDGVPDNRTDRPKQPETVVGSKHESMLRYARPIAEDGEISYEFYHDPGQAIVHPSLDRLAFLLEADGVKVHRITDGKHDRTGLDPGNATDEPSNRRGPAKLPLKPGEWNRMILAIRGDEVTLKLNGEVVFARPIEPTNRRDFGLFHFADESEARVRDVVYRGEWPRSIPPELVAGKEH